MDLTYLYPAILIVFLGGVCVRPVVLTIDGFIDIVTWLAIFIGLALGCVIGVDTLLEVIAR